MCKNLGPKLILLVVLVLIICVIVISLRARPRTPVPPGPWNPDVVNADGEAAVNLSPVRVDESASDRIFAHYFPAFPVSYENVSPDADYYATEYLDPNGEGGKHKSYGGFLRNRPMPREVIRSTDWEIRDFEREIETAQSFGIDGFVVDIIEIEGGYWERVVGLVQAADRMDSGFKIILGLDMNTLPSTLDVSQLAEALDGIARSPSLLRDSAGAVVLAPFAAENRTPEWWRGFLTAGNDRGTDFSLILVFVDVADNLKKYSSVAAGFGNWGAKDPVSIRLEADYAAAAHAMGKLWISPVVAQDYRPSQQVYAEAANTGALRASWSKAERDQADLVQLVTWNDYAESTAIAPSVASGTGLLALNSYFAREFDSGVTPTITKDQVFVSYRRCFAGYVGTGQTDVTHRIGIQPAVDEVEIVAFLTQPALLEWNVGSDSYSKRLAAGLVVERVPLSTGEITAELSRDGETVGQLRSRVFIQGECETQDLTYYLDQMKMSEP